MKYRRRKGIKGLILALATAAILVSAASAKTYEGGSTGYVEVAGAKVQGYTPQALKAMTDSWNLRAQAYEQAQRPDDRAGIHGVGTATAQSDYVDRQLANLVAKAKLVAQAYHVDDRAGIRGPGPIETPTVISVHGNGFDWTDAGIGAGTAALVAAIILAAVAMTRRRPELAA
jgi:hypothetical protein